MGTYKVIQDIEAEDKLLGPLTFRQFVFALIGLFLGYINFILVTKHVYLLIPLFLLPALFFIFFALPFGRDQPTEVWALAKLRFLFKPRRRIWDQSGVKELVTINVPKREVHIYTDGLSQNEVKSRLQALADTIDSRGWATKNVNMGVFSQAGALALEGQSDRLSQGAAAPQQVPEFQIQASEDIMDNQNNPVAQQFDQMINASTVAHRKQLVEELNGIREQQNGQKTIAQEAAESMWFQDHSATAAVDSQAMFGAQGALTAGQPQMLAAQQYAQLPAQQVYAQSPAMPASQQYQTAQQSPYPDQMQQAYSQPGQAQYGQQPVQYAQPIDYQAAGAAQIYSNDDAHLAEIRDQVDSAERLSTALVHQAQVQEQYTYGQQTASGMPVTSQPDPAILSLSNNNDLSIATLAREASRTRAQEGSSEDPGEVVISLR